MRTVAVTPKLDKRMKQASRDTEVNWSMVARKAFRRELDRLDEENV